jgi:hypothetical protein
LGEFSRSGLASISDMNRSIPDGSMIEYRHQQIRKTMKSTKKLANEIVTQMFVVVSLSFVAFNIFAKTAAMNENKQQDLIDASNKIGEATRAYEAKKAAELEAAKISEISGCTPTVSTPTTKTYIDTETGKPREATDWEKKVEAAQTKIDADAIESRKLQCEANKIAAKLTQK